MTPNPERRNPMTEYTVDELRELIGEVPTWRKMPAAWWVTTDPGQIEAIDRYGADFEKRRAEIAEFAATLGLKDTDAMMFTGFGSAELTGFNPPQAMTFWKGHPDYRPPPAGWRIDSKKGYLVPSRRTKADRESQVNKDFAAVRKIPHIAKYMSGLPNEIHIEDRDFGGTIYSTSYRRGANCVMAFSGADPERAGPHHFDKVTINTDIWHRQKLSALLALREEAEAAR